MSTFGRCLARARSTRPDASRLRCGARRIGRSGDGTPARCRSCRAHRHDSSPVSRLHPHHPIAHTSRRRPRRAPPCVVSPECCSTVCGSTSNTVVCRCWVSPSASSSTTTRSRWRCPSTPQLRRRSMQRSTRCTTDSAVPRRAVRHRSVERWSRCRCCPTDTLRRGSTTIYRAARVHRAIPTDRRPRSSPPTDRSTGFAHLGSTPHRCSPRCSMPTGAGTARSARTPRP